MGHEVDFLPVGNGECSGDAIALRFGNLDGARTEQAVVVIDGGYQQSGEELVALIKKHYNTTHVDLVISSHPDNDHSGGLSVVLEKLTVGQLWMHQPWKHTQDIARMFHDGRVTDTSVKESLRRSLESICGLEKIANRKGIPIIEPFTGVNAWNGMVTVVGPTQQYYEALLGDFRCTPDVKDTSAALLERILATLSEGANAVMEKWNIETLKDDGVTSAENNSSTIVLVRPTSGRALLFTADAGIPALTLAANTLDSWMFNYEDISLIQVPHHGSRRNVGPTILNRLIGPIKAEDRHLRSAFVSAAKGGAPKHPAKKVTNAFRRRGAYVFGTMDGCAIRHKYFAPERDGYTAVEPVPFYPEVEESESEAA